MGICATRQEQWQTSQPNEHRDRELTQQQLWKHQLDTMLALYSPQQSPLSLPVADAILTLHASADKGTASTYSTDRVDAIASAVRTSAPHCVGTLERCDP